MARTVAARGRRWRWRPKPAVRRESGARTPSAARLRSAALRQSTRRLIRLLALAALPALSGACGAAQPDRADGVYAEIHTNKGVIVARLEPERAPLATTNFVGLAEGTIDNAAFDPGRPYYAGTVFHRVVPGHVIQAGEPRSEWADGPGYVFPNEIHAELSHDHAGALGVANNGPHTNGGQFYITLGDRSYLDGDYIVFGEVVEGMDVVRSIVRDDVVDSVRIARVGARAEAFRPDTERFRELIEAAERRVAEHEERKRAAQRAWIESRWPDAVGPEDGLRVVWRDVDAMGAGGPNAGESAALLRVRYRGTAVRYLAHLLGYDGPELDTIAFGSGPEGQPGFDDPPRTFTFTPRETELNPALDSLLARAAPGARFVAIVPPELGYGESGLYTPETPGEPRFVIPPNTLLVYETEVAAEDGSAAGRP